MSSHYDKELLRSIDEKLDHVSEIQIRMEGDLKYHIKRTDILEKQVKPLGRIYEAAKLLVPTIAAILYFKDTILRFLGE